jgi:HK97 family phage prohead protease
MQQLRLENDNLSDFGDRAVTLCDGRTGLRGGLKVEIKAQDNAPIIDFTASNERLDRYDEIITASGWRLENYRRNPVFQNSHRYSDVVHTLGRSLVTEVIGDALFQRIEFAVEANPVAKLAYDLYRGKFLNAVSVGFIPIRWENGGEDAEFRRRYLEQELLELSAVSIPANPDALQLAVKAGAVQVPDLRDLADFLKQFCGNTAVPGVNTSALEPDDNVAQLLRLARELGTILRRA